MNDFGTGLLYSIEDLVKEANSIERYLGGEEMTNKQKRNYSGMHYLNQNTMNKVDKIKKITKIKQEANEEKNHVDERKKENIPV